ncbi:MAG TPA: hypothetical protein VGK59_10955 [Ohtaekwangia sp.]
MAKVIVSGNLNQRGNFGQFESDRSTWGFPDDGDNVAVRSGAFNTAGLYSCLLTKNFFGNSFLLPCAWAGAVGKKYIVKAKVRTPSGTPIGGGAALITFRESLSNFHFGLTTIDYVDKTVTEATNNWVDIEISLSATSAPLSPLYGIGIVLDGVGSAGGKIYVDQFEVYEYIDSDEEPPDPEDPEPEDTDRVLHHKNPITLGKAASEGWDEEINYRLYCDVRTEDVADSTTYISKLNVELPPDSSGNVTFYLQEAFRNVLKPVAPTLNHDSIIRLTDRIKRFKTYTGELVNTEVTPGALEASLPNLVLWGGIDKFHYPGLNYFTSYLPDKKKFLTWAPVEKYVDRLQEDYLMFWVYGEFAALKLQIKAYFDDATNETDVVMELTGTAYGQLYLIPAGPGNSKAALVNPAKNLVKYELSLLDHEDSLISEVRTYYVTSFKKPDTRYFMFLNSLGSFEVLRFTGKASEVTEYRRDVVQKFLPRNYAAMDGEFAVNDISMEEKKSYGSGYITGKLAKQWHEYLKDFLLSPMIYDVTTGQRIPVVISGGNHLQEDDNYERFIRFEAKPAYNNNSFTPAEI